MAKWINGGGMSRRDTYGRRKLLIVLSKFKNAK